MICNILVEQFQQQQEEDRYTMKHISSIMQHVSSKKLMTLNVPCFETWSDKEAAAKTWNTFKTHFTKNTYNGELKKFRGGKLKEVGYHQANSMLSQQIIQQVTDLKEQVTNLTSKDDESDIPTLPMQCKR